MAGETAPLTPSIEELPIFEEEEPTPSSTSDVTRTILQETSGPGEQFEVLGARLRALGRDRLLRRIGVVSAAQGDGRTTVSIGLGRSLAAHGQRRVLLLELDLRRPAIDDALGLEPPTAGLRRYLEDDTVSTLTVRRSGPGAFWVLSAGEGARPRPEVLTSSRMLALLGSTERVFDYTIIDCPPLQTSADAVILQEHVDAYVFVVRVRHSPREAVQQAAGLLKPERVCGVVVNGYP